MARTPRILYVDAQPRRPLWARAAAATAETIRDLRATPTDPSGLALTVSPDGRPVLAPTPTRQEAPRTRAIRWSWRERRTLAPIPPGLGYALLNATHPAGPRAIAAAALAAPLIAAGVWVSILGGRDRTPATLTIVAAGVLAMTTWWLLPDSIVPPGGIAPITAAAVAASGWRFRIRQEDPVPDPHPDVPWQVQRWDDLIGCPGGALPGAVAHFAGHVYPPSDDAIPGEVIAQRDETAPIGFQLGVDLVPGKHEVATLRAKLGILAGVYGAQKAGTVLDETDSEVRARITFTTRVYLAEIKVWTRPTLDLARGRFTWQTLADGSPGHCQVWIPGQGIRHVWLVGAMGGGKSGAVDCFLANVLHAGIAVADLTDLKGGASIPHWRHRAHRFGTTYSAGIAALRRGVLMVNYRYWLMARMPAVRADGTPALIDGQPTHGRTWIDPTPELPIYIVLIEEWTQLVAPGNPLAPLAITLAARIAALGRAGLVMLAVTTQPANLDLAFGGNRDLRTNIQAGNVHVLWTDQGSGNLATATRTIDLSKIPQGQPGVGYLVGPGQPRDLRGRVPYVAEPIDAVNAAQPAHLGPRELALLDAIDKVPHNATPDTAQAAITALLTARPDDPDWPHIVRDVFAPLIHKAPALAPTGTGDVTWTGPPVFGDTPDTPDTPDTDGQRAILDALATGDRTAAELRAALGHVTDQALRHHLNPLIPTKVERTTHGRYHLTGGTP